MNEENDRFKTSPLRISDEKMDLSNGYNDC